MSVSKPAKVSTVEPIKALTIKVDEFKLLEKGFSLLLQDGITLVHPWSKVQSFYFLGIEARLILEDGKVYSYDFGDNADHFNQVLKAYVSSF